MSLIDTVLANKLFTDRRRVSLYSNFRKLKDSNIDGYEANIAAWKILLTDALDQGNFEDATAIPGGPGLLEALYDPDNGRPLALDVVIDELVADKVLIPLPIYMAEKSSIYSQGAWLTKMLNPKVVTSWVLSYTKVWDSSWKSIGPKAELGTLKKEKYISIQALETIGNAIWANLENEHGITASYTNGVFTKEMLTSLLSEVSVTKKIHNTVQTSRVLLSPTDIEVVLKYLVRDKNKLISDGQIYKVNSRNASPLITQKDIAIANLRSTILQVTDRVNGLSDQIADCDLKARNALERKNKPVAVYALKSKKLAESSQVKALDMLSNLELLVGKIDDATDQAEIVSALSSGAEILTTLNSTIGGAEKVGDLMDQLRDQADETDEIGREISSMVGRSVDEDEVESELDLMLAEERQKQLDKLPVPPTNSTHATPAKDSQEDPAIASLSDELSATSLEPRKKVLAE
ncbi:hypothetical protein AWJ20_4038 [Sugiyamaella lignohabitans]|uniref:Snf7p n=1 Tax=Sugiyamaella lignohabitans TaxID=796027 RepID=A0A167C5B2_9ASCO|nr:uncharacterized protein AWJ20_4038 [Sugiyamaella lignohabitans]ANB11235.1 hypothetical protein AWJ20_4038 [Sugiyamaella lignohabitans]